MSEPSVLTDALLAAGTVALLLCGLFYGLHRVVVWARQRRKRAYVVGAVLSPFMGLGNVVDPDFRIVHEAKRLKNREDDDPGDPPESEEESLIVQASRSAEPAAVPVARRESVVAPEPAPSTRRPALVWAIASVLGFAATSTSLALSWLLLSNSAALALPARLARASLTVFEWSALYAMSALLLTSMILLFRLRKSSVRVFAAYLALGVLGAAWLVVTRENAPYFDIRVTLLAGLPAAVAVLAYMLRLKNRAVLS